MGKKTKNGFERLEVGEIVRVWNRNKSEQEKNNYNKNKKKEECKVGKEKGGAKCEILNK